MRYAESQQMTATALSIRRLRGDDAEFVLQLSDAAFSEFSRDPARPTLWMAEHFTGLLAIRGERRVGFAVVRVERSRLAELQAIAVIESERGRGVGRALLEAVERRARVGGSIGLVLHTAEANLAAIELFLKTGFRIRRHLRRYYLGVYDACEMVKRW
jgi:ribosomal protein S18 acetylase RimI-like enzyme